MLLVDDDQADRAQGGEHRRPRANDHVDVAAPYAMPLIVTLTVGEAAVLNGHPLAKRLAELERDGRRQRNLGHQQQNPTAAAPHFCCEPQVELGLAAAGDAVQERRLKTAALDEPAQGRQRGLLFGGENERRSRRRDNPIVRPKRVAFDLPPAERDEAQRGQPCQCRRSDAASDRQLGRLEAVRCAGQKHQGLALARSQPQRIEVPRAGVFFQPSRDLHSLRRQRRHANGSEGARRTAGRTGGSHRRHRRRERRTDSAGVIVRHPGREAHDVFGQVRLRIQDFDDGFYGRSRRLVDIRAIDDAAGEDPAAERHEHPGADDGELMVVGEAVGQAVERGHGHRDANEAHLLNVGLRPTPRLGRLRGPLALEARRARLSPTRWRADGPRRWRPWPNLIVGRFLQERADLLHVLPDVTLAVGAAQQERGVKGRDERRAAVLERATAEPRDRILRLQQRLRGERPQRDDDLRPNAVDLLKEERLAGLDLVRLGIAVLGRPALDDVGDVDLVAPKPDGLDDLREELARAPDERDALNVFVRAGRFADEHQIRRRVAHTEHDLPAAQLVQLATRAVADLGADPLQCLFRRACKLHRFSRARPCGRHLDGRRILHNCRTTGVPGRDRCGRPAAPPAGVEADARHAKFLEESEVFREVSVVHDWSSVPQPLCFR